MNRPRHQTPCRARSPTEIRCYGGPIWRGGGGRRTEFAAIAVQGASHTAEGFLANLISYREEPPLLNVIDEQAGFVNKTGSYSDYR